MPRRPARRSLQRVLPAVPLDVMPAQLVLQLEGVPRPAPPVRAVVARVRQDGKWRVRVVSGGDRDALVQFDQEERKHWTRWSVEALVWIEPRGGRGYYRAAGEIRRLKEPDEEHA